MEGQTFSYHVINLYANEYEDVKRTKKGGDVEVIKKPVAVCRYNEYMGGVDLADHYIASYSFTRKTVKWWRKIFFWLLEISLVNAFILHNTNRPPGQTEKRQRKFRNQVIRSLVGDFRNTRKRGRPSSMNDKERLNGKLHVPEFLAAGKNKDCVVCSNRTDKGERRRTRLFCKTCTTNPGLHPGDCFSRYHSLQVFKKINDFFILKS